MSTELDDEVRQYVSFALQHAQGRYESERASQLSGVPRSTLYNWRMDGVYVPDFVVSKPYAWSYRDLIYVRLLAWLRQLGMGRKTASREVNGVKSAASRGEDIRTLHASREFLGYNDEMNNRIGPNMLPFEGFYDLLGVFDLLEPVEDLKGNTKRQRLWAPDLVQPSEHSYISPFVLAGEPCITETRVPTASVYALYEERGLSNDDVSRLYPGVTAAAAVDARQLERRLRGFDLPDISAA